MKIRFQADACLDHDIVTILFNLAQIFVTMLAFENGQMDDLIGMINQRTRILLMTEFRAELFLSFVFRLIRFLIARRRLRGIARIRGTG